VNNGRSSQLEDHHSWPRRSVTSGSRSRYAPFSGTRNLWTAVPQMYVVDRLTSVNGSAGIRFLVKSYVISGPLKSITRSKRWKGRTISPGMILYLRHPTLPLVVHAIILQHHMFSGSHAIQQSITGKINQVLAGMLQYVQVTPKKSSRAHRLSS
jgi:hypothetical protein